MIYFSDFGVAGPTSDVILAVQDFQTGTTTGVAQDYTAAPLTGITPKAALVFGTFHEVATGASEQASAVLSIGAIASTNQRIISVASEDNQTSTDTRRMAANDHVFRLTHMSGTTSNATGVGTLISGGLSITYSQTNADRRGNFMAFAGTDVTAACADIDLGTGTSDIAVSLAFQPDVVFLFSNHPSNFNPAVGTTLNMTFGIATSDGTQRCVAMQEATANAAGGVPLQAILTDSCAAEISGAGALTFKLVAGNFSGSGFTLTPSASASSVNIAYLALKFTGRQVKLLSFTSPTATGSQAITGAGFTPQAAVLVMTNLEATDPTFSIATDDTMGGLSFNFIGDEQWAQAARLNSGSDPTDTASFTGNYAVVQPSATDCKAGLATLTSFDSDGMTLNWSAVQGTAKKGFILFIE